jgi:peptide/nickel transport system permease protein
MGITVPRPFPPSSLPFLSINVLPGSPEADISAIAWQRRQLVRHLLRRIGFYLLAIWASLTVSFIIPRLAPGNPATPYLARAQQQGQQMTPEQLHALEAMFGVSHDPIWVQYFQYLGNLLHGNLGISTTQYPQPVTQVIGQDLIWTLRLVTVAVAISFILGCLIGIVSAWRRGSLFDSTVPVALSFLSAVPYFWMAMILLYVFGFLLHWFPFSDGYDLNLTPDWGDPNFVLSVFNHALLPGLTIIISTLAGWMLTMRNSMVTTLSEDYVQMARAKGLSDRSIMLTYAARNAILPNIAGMALSIGYIVGGQLLTEVVFSYPGIGYTLYQAVIGHDYALMQGIFMIITLAVILANFLADILFTILDPRVRQERSA